MAWVPSGVAAQLTNQQKKEARRSEHNGHILSCKAWQSHRPRVCEAATRNHRELQGRIFFASFGVAEFWQVLQCKCDSCRSSRTSGGDAHGIALGVDDEQ